jgi:4'-phosphopantetheinyl transferase
MPLYQLEKISNDQVLAIWRMGENLSELETLAQLHIPQIQIPDYINHPNKKQEWLATRIALKQCCDVLNIEYKGTYKSDTGQSFLVNEGAHISISHASDFAAIIVNKHKAVGIDVEKISPKVEKVAHKYLNAEEIEPDIERLALKWSIKEAIYKVSDHRQLSLKDDILIYHCETKDEGTANVKVKKQDDYTCRFFKIENYFIVYTL